MLFQREPYFGHLDYFFEQISQQSIIGLLTFSIKEILEKAFCREKVVN